MAGIRGIKVDSPGAIVALVVGVLIAVQLVGVTFPLITQSFGTLGGLGNFTFASFFQDGGLASLLLSVGILIGIFAIMGINSKNKR